VWVTAVVGFFVAVGVAVGVGLGVDVAVFVAECVLVADARAVAVDRAVDVAEAGAETAGEVLTVLLACGVDVAGVLGCGVGMEGKLETGPLGVQAETATATSSAPANPVRRTFMKPPRLPGGKSRP
jgi:hypothetical protein